MKYLKKHSKMGSGVSYLMSRGNEWLVNNDTNIQYSNIGACKPGLILFITLECQTPCQG